MKVELLKDFDHGKKGDVIDGADASGRDCWRLCFPMHKCCAKPIDAEALAAMNREIEKIDPRHRERVIDLMRDSGSIPKADAFAEKVRGIKSQAVSDDELEKLTAPEKTRKGA